MTRFSERQGIIRAKGIQLKDLDTDLRSSLWNICRRCWFEEVNNIDSLREDIELYHIACLLYEYFYKRPVGDLPYETIKFVHSQRKFFLEGQWYQVYDIVEFLHSEYQEGSQPQQEFEANINKVLEREKAGYRMIGGVITPITNAVELAEIGEALTHSGKYFPISEHIKSSLSLYSRKPEPDYRNSIKESISAIESASKIISGKTAASLADTLAAVENKHSLHTAFKQGVIKLYGWTSDAGGIRHALVEASDVDEADARYMLVSCSAFANYLISKSS